ncbi:aminopeptidase [candidate division WOR-3 bacterium]|nr:aminopeptidase [candidate division WOR-3 bacterium]
MFDLKKYYREENEKVRDSYEQTLLDIQKICSKTEGYANAGQKKEYYRFFNYTGIFILRLAEYETKVGEDYFTKRTFEELREENQSFYADLFTPNYEESYANPTYSVKLFGDKFGQLFSYFYILFRQNINHALYHRIFKMERFNRLFSEAFDFVDNNQLDYETLKEIITRLRREHSVQDAVRGTTEEFSSDFGYNKSIVLESDLDDIRYLFAYGRYVSDNEIKTAQFFTAYPSSKVKKLARQIAKAYVEGFKRDNKDISKKSTVSVVFNLGQEHLVRELIEKLKEYGLESVENYVLSTRPNKQYDYDHKFDNALYLDEAYTQLIEQNFAQAFEKCSKMMNKSSGVAVIEKFGESPFKPQPKAELLRFSEAQQKLLMTHQGSLARERDKYVPQKETSFTIVAFPSPEIGEGFGEIFEDILEVNMLDTDKYEGIQQTIIQALDKADYVRVKGRGDNETDLVVKMQELKDPFKHTNFVNCGADINIPVGEVYTSPQLKGTNGILHVEEAYIEQLKYADLRLTFKDGYVTDYSCSNFENKEDNRKFIEENLLFPHKTLPMGEFAIGTNTLAYVIARKHDILDVLPVLIIEKMGPHFAVGDTCFARGEDIPVFNKLDNKEITARDNEKSIARKTDPAQAYTYQHADITIPYSSLGSITVVAKSDERIEIIRDSKFVLPGTEELNEPFKELTS